MWSRSVHPSALINTIITHSTLKLIKFILYFTVLESRVQELYDVLPKLNLGTKNQKFTCTKCNQLMIRAYKANSCQHRFCGQCIRLLQRNEKCPRDGQFMSTQKVYQSNKQGRTGKKITFCHFQNYWPIHIQFGKHPYQPTGPFWHRPFNHLTELPDGQPPLITKLFHSVKKFLSEK